MWPERLCHTRVSGGKELACNLRREGATCQGGCEMDKKSLRTHNRRKAERIRDARNQAAERPQLGIAMANRQGGSAKAPLEKRFLGMKSQSVSKFGGISAL